MIGRGNLGWDGLPTIDKNLQERLTFKLVDDEPCLPGGVTPSNPGSGVDYAAIKRQIETCFNNKGQGLDDLLKILDQYGIKHPENGFYIEISDNNVGRWTFFNNTKFQTEVLDPLKTLEEKGEGNLSSILEKIASVDPDYKKVEVAAGYKLTFEANGESYLFVLPKESSSNNGSGSGSGTGNGTGTGTGTRRPALPDIVVTWGRGPLVRLPFEPIAITDRIVDTGSTEGTDEPELEKPNDNIFEVIDLKDIKGYTGNASFGMIKCEFTEASFYEKQLKNQAKEFLSQYKETFKSYACGLMGESFASEYGALFDSVLESYMDNGAVMDRKDVGIYCFMSYKTKDLVDGFLTKLDEAIKAKIPPKEES